MMTILSRRRYSGFQYDRPRGQVRGLRGTHQFPGRRRVALSSLLSFLLTQTLPPSLGYEQCYVRLPRFARSLADAVTLADENEHGALVLLRLLCLIPLRVARFRNRLHAADRLTAPKVADPDLTKSCR